MHKVLANCFAGLLLAVLLAVGLACKKKKSTEGPAPAKAILVSPQSNSTCTTGTILSASQAKITLSWSAASNASSYEVKVRNLLNQNISTHTVSATQIELDLLRNTPYSWSVISKSANNASTAQSETWKFYVAGEASFSYAPFPADVVSPANGQAVNATTGKVSLDWTASDVDNDIVSYDVYLGTSTANMAVVKSNLTESLANDIAVSKGNTYCWKVLSRDSKGNVSWSAVWQFKAEM